jgi:hypothetical protein
MLLTPSQGTYYVPRRRRCAYVSALFKVFSDESHMSGSEIDDGTDKATAWKLKRDLI